MVLSSEHSGRRFLDVYKKSIFDYLSRLTLSCKVYRASFILKVAVDDMY